MQCKQYQNRDIKGPHRIGPATARPRPSAPIFAALLGALLVALPLGCDSSRGADRVQSIALSAAATRQAEAAANPSAVPDLAASIIAWPGGPGAFPAIALPPRQADPQKLEVARILCDQGKSAYDAGDWNEADLILDQALDLDPWHAPAYYYRGAANSNLGSHHTLPDRLRQLQLEVADYCRAIAADPTWSPPYYARATAFLARADLEPLREDRHEWLELALADFRRSVDLDAGRAEAHCDCAGILTQLGDLDGAYQHSLLCPLEGTEGYLARSVGLRVHGDEEQALEVVGEIMATEPEDPELYWERGTIRLDQGEYEQALADYQAAVDLWGEEYAPGTLFFDEAEAEYYLGHYRKAEEHIQEGRLNTWLDWGSPYYYLGMVYLQQGDTEAALVALHWAEQTLDEGYLLDATREELWKLGSP